MTIVQVQESLNLKSVINKLPTEILIQIIEKLEIIDAKSFSDALRIPFKLICQYHSYSDAHEYCHYFFSTDKTVFYKSFYMNKTFQSAVHGNKKVFIAIGTDDLNILKSALNDPEIDHNQYHNPITSASILGNFDAVKLLVSEYGIDPSSCKNSAIVAASMEGHYEIVKYLLLDKRVDPSDQNNEALRLAVSNNHEEIIKLLLSDSRVDSESVLDYESQDEVYE